MAMTLPDRLRIEGPPPEGAPARFAATDTQTETRVFVKWDTAAPTIRREAEVLSAIASPGVARLVDWHEGPQGSWLATEFVDGDNLETFIAANGGPLDPVTFVAILKRLGETLGEVHSKGFLHRDLKPANVVMQGDTTPVIVDFGAAGTIESANASQDHSFVSDGYGAPEQYLTDKPEGAWTDVYGLGAIAYRALTGKAPPFALDRLADETGSILAELPGDCPVAIGRSIDWALRPEPADRPQSAEAWLQVLGGAPLPRAQKTRLVAAFDPQFDDLPPTIPVRRIPLATAMSAPPLQAAVMPTTPAAPPRRGGLSIAIPLLFGLVAILAAAAWYGWPFYERYYKKAWTVDATGSADAKTIAEALSRAGPGAVISIAPGTYTDSLVIAHSVQLQAALEDDPPLIAPAEGPCLVSEGSGAVISNLRLALPAESGASASPLGCVVVDGGSMTVENSEISSAQGPAVFIRNGANPSVTGNTIDGGTGPGIVVASGSTGMISGNTLKGLEKQSVVVRGGATPDITDNTIESSGGVVFIEGAGGSFRGNRILSARANAIEIGTGANPLVADNMIKDAAEAGIYIYDYGNGRIEGNAIVAGKLSGIVVAGGGRPALIGNSVRDNGEHGVLVLDQSRIVLERNAVENNKGHGLVIGSGSNIELKDNTFEGNTNPQVLDTRPPK